MPGGLPEGEADGRQVAGGSQEYVLYPGCGDTVEDDQGCFNGQREVVP